MCSTLNLSIQFFLRMDSSSPCIIFLPSVIHIRTSACSWNYGHIPRICCRKALYLSRHRFFTDSRAVHSDEALKLTKKIWNSFRSKTEAFTTSALRMVLRFGKGCFTQQYRSMRVGMKWILLSRRSTRTPSPHPSQTPDLSPSLLKHYMSSVSFSKQRHSQPYLKLACCITSRQIPTNLEMPLDWTQESLNAKCQ